MTLQALASRIERKHPRLIKALELAGEDAFAEASTTAGTLLLLGDHRDIFQDLSAVLNEIPQDLLNLLGAV